MEHGAWGMKHGAWGMEHGARRKTKDEREMIHHTSPELKAEEHNHI
jgi:hypothetical protein